MPKVISSCRRSAVSMDVLVQEVTMRSVSCVVGRLDDHHYLVLPYHHPVYKGPQIPLLHYSSTAQMLGKAHWQCRKTCSYRMSRTPKKSSFSH